MSDGRIEIDTQINTEGAEQGTNKLKNALNQLKNNPAAAALTKVSGAVAAVTVVTKAATKAIKETTAAYKNQATAEKQLEIAAKNNPYLDSMAVRQLKDYAGQLQSISTVGDEQLLPMMSRLAIAGRTQAEIQSIMKAALDLSAGGFMSLDAAVTNLNATYNGNIGLMGRQFGELKNLTKEELEQGKAVEILGNKVKGLAAETAKATGSSEQLKNAFGDLKEEVGAEFEKGLIPMRRALTDLITKIAKAKKELREIQEGAASYDEGTRTVDTITAKIKATNEQLTADKKMIENYDALTDEQKKQYGIQASTITQIKERITKNTALNKTLQEQLKAAVALEKGQEAAAKIDAKNAEAAAAEIAAEKNAIETRDELRAAYDETIRVTQEEINQRRRLGEEITEQQEAEELLNAATAAYIKMMTDPAFEGNSGNWDHEAKAREQIAKWAEKAAVSDEKDREALEAAADFLARYEETNLVDQIDATIEKLKEEARELGTNQKEWTAYHVKIAQLEALKTKTLKEEAAQQAQDQKAALARMFSNINSYYSQFAQITQSVTDLIQQSNDESTNEELTTLSEQYTAGLMSYEQYCDEKLRIEQESARQSYKIKIWEWTSQLLQATANTAAGIASALAEAGVPTALKIINAALIGTSGAAQVAAISANKPKAPAFEHGGIVPGNSYTGDRVTAKLNSAEMVLTRSQQARLWKMANGTAGAAGVNLNVDVQNNNAAENEVSTRMTARGLSIVIDKKVNDGFLKGNYTKSFLEAQAAAGGNKIL